MAGNPRRLIRIVVLAVVLAVSSCSAGTERPDQTPTARPAPTTAPTAAPSPAVAPTISPTTPAASSTLGQTEGEPFLALDPPDANPGQPVQVTGRGFAPGNWIRLRAGVPLTDGEGADLARTQADQQGELKASIEVPAGSVTQPDGSVVISAVDESRGESLAIAVLFSSQAGGATKNEQATPGVVITGEVKEVQESAHVISFQDEVHGFTTVAVSRGAEITSADGSPKTLQDIKPGAVIQTAGAAIGSGTVLAEKIRIIPKPA